MSKKEGRYYVEYLGWKESSGLYGREFTEPVIRELLARRRLNSELPKMTIKLNSTELQISQEIIKKSGGKPEKTKYPSIPTKDASFVIQGLYPDTDVVACIFLGYNPYTKCAIHVHIYRFDSETTAKMFVNHLSSIIDRPEYRNRILGIEKDLSEIGHVTLRRQLEATSVQSPRHNSEGSDNGYGTRSPVSSSSLSPQYPTADEALKQRSDIRIQKVAKTPEPDKNVKRMFSSLQEELEYKMNLEEAPILLPPKDYDTIVRRHGHLEIRDEIKASIIGPNGIFTHLEAQPYNGQIDEAMSSESSHTHESDSTDIPSVSQADRSSNGSQQNVYLKPTNGHGLARSQSDSNANHIVQKPIHRQHSQASSDRSNTSDDYFADGLYQGYRPKGKHQRSRSKDSNKQSHEDLNTSQMAMWSPTFSFGQTGMRNLPTHHEEEIDPLNRTAPAGMLTRRELVVPVQDYDNYTITRTNGHGHVKRSHSHKHKGEGGRHKNR